jgi:hypothetical protein
VFESFLMVGSIVDLRHHWLWVDLIPILSLLRCHLRTIVHASS